MRDINNLSFNALVLAGGRSSRMGQDKAKLKLANGVTLLQQAEQLLREAGAGQVLVNHPDAAAKQKVKDLYPARGPLSGIHGALHQNDKLPLLILPVDMPLMTPLYLRQLVQYGQQKQQSCYFDEQCLPLYVFQSDKAEQLISEWLSAGESPSVWRLVKALQAETLPLPEKNAFKNANDPKQWQECLQHNSER